MDTTTHPPSRAVVARRWALIAAPAVAGLCTIVGVMADPAPLDQGADLVEAYAQHPGPLQFKALGYHVAYTLWPAAALGLVALVRRRGAWLANVTGVLALLAISSIPGFLMGDFVDSAMGRLVGVETAVAVGESVTEQWAFRVMQIPGLVGLVLAVPLATAAAARARLLPWWPTAAVVMGFVAFFGFAVTLPGNLIFAAALGALSVAIARIDPHHWTTRGGPAAAPAVAAATPEAVTAASDGGLR